MSSKLFSLITKLKVNLTLAFIKPTTPSLVTTMITTKLKKSSLYPPVLHGQLAIALAIVTTSAQCICTSLMIMKPLWSLVLRGT